MGSSHLDESQAPEGFDGSSTSELTGDGLEAAHIARALALKLGSRQVGLWGCAADSITRVLTAQLRPVRIESEGDDSTELSGGIAMIATHLLLSGEIGDRLPGVLSRVCAAVVMDPDGVLGIDDMPTIVGAAHDAGSDRRSQVVRPREPHRRRFALKPSVGHFGRPRSAACEAACRGSEKPRVRSSRRSRATRRKPGTNLHRVV